MESYGAVAAEFAAGGRRELDDPVSLATSYLTETLGRAANAKVTVVLAGKPEISLPAFQQYRFTASSSGPRIAPGVVTVERYADQDGFWFVSGTRSEDLYPMDADTDAAGQVHPASITTADPTGTADVEYDGLSSSEKPAARHVTVGGQQRIESPAAHADAQGTFFRIVFTDEAGEVSLMEGVYYA